METSNERYSEDTRRLSAEQDAGLATAGGAFGHASRASHSVERRTNLKPAPPLTLYQPPPIPQLFSLSLSPSLFIILLFRHIRAPLAMTTLVSTGPESDWFFLQLDSFYGDAFSFYFSFFFLRWPSIAEWFFILFHTAEPDWEFFFFFLALFFSLTGSIMNEWKWRPRCRL